MQEERLNHSRNKEEDCIEVTIPVWFTCVLGKSNHQPGEGRGIMRRDEEEKEKEEEERK